MDGQVITNILKIMETKIKSNIISGKETTSRLLSGIKVATQAIRLSYGWKGCSAVVENERYPFHQVVRDCQTIIQATQISDDIEKRGLAFLKELSDKADKDSGNGRKTTCILAEEILERGYKLDIPAEDLKLELNALIPVIEKNLDEQKTNISVQDVKAVATIASQSEELGTLLGEIYQHIGAEGIVILEGSGTPNHSISYINGIRFIGTGYLTETMVYDELAQKENRPEREAIYENPIVLVTKKKIERDSDIAPLVQKAIDSNKALVIFTHDMDSAVASRLIATHRAKVAKILIIKAPTLWTEAIFEDFAKCTGATIVGDGTGLNYKNLPLSALGTCAKITVDKDETTIEGAQDISDHIAQLKKNDDTESKLRLSWLQTHTAILRLGANGESELSDKRLRCKDGIHSSRLALKDGIVPGGAISLFRASYSLPGTLVGNLMREVLQAPVKQLCLNAKVEVPESFGDAVIDATAVIKNAVRNAVSLAATILPCQIVITIPPKSPEQLALMSASLQANRMGL